MPEFETNILGKQATIEYEVRGGVKVHANTSRTPRMDVRVLNVRGIDPKSINKRTKTQVQAAIRRDMGFDGQLVASWERDIQGSRIRSHHVAYEDGDTETTIEEIIELFGTQLIQSTE